MIHNVYLIGTGHHSGESAQLFPQVHARYDESPPEQKHLVEGVGSRAFVAFQAPASNPLGLEGDSSPAKIRGKLTGKGWGGNLKRVVTALMEANARTPITGVNLVGHSRGAVTCHMIAHAIHHVFQGRVPCNIFAFDPVPGGMTDFSTWWELGAADRTALGLDDKTAELLPPNVRNYFAILMERDTNSFFGVLGPKRLQFSGATHARYLPLFGKHGDCVKSDLPNYPASRIALSLLLEHLRMWNHVPVDDRLILNAHGYLEEYSRLHRRSRDAGADPKAIANYGVGTVLTGVGVSLCGGLPALGYFSSYWRNRRADDIASKMRDHAFFLNGHHRACFAAEPACRELGLRQMQHGWADRDFAERFRAQYRQSYVLLVRLGMMRSVNAPADEVAIEDPGDTFIDVPPKGQQLRQLAGAITAQLPPAGGLRVIAPNVFSLEQWKAASRVRVGARRDQVAEIDRLLPAYHRADADGNRARAQRLLYRIGVQVESHLRTKANSDRRDAMLQLARQVASKLQDRG